MPSEPSYHDLHITTAQIPRTSIFNLPYDLEVICCRVTGWRLYEHLDDGSALLLAGEYDGDWLVLDVAGHVIVDSRNDVGEDGDGEIVTVRDDRGRGQKAADAPESGRSATEGQDLA